MRDRGSASPAPSDGTYGPQTVAAMQRYFNDLGMASPHFFVDQRGEVHQMAKTHDVADVETRPAFEDMNLREQAMHLYVEHGFNSAYFYGYFEGWGSDHNSPSPADTYDMESMSGVLQYFQEHEGYKGMYDWHDPDHDEEPLGGGDIKHLHRPSEKLPADVIASLDDAFHADRN
jgi:hypothetical protein